MRHRMISIERLEAIARAAILGGYGHVMTWSDRDQRFAGQVRRKVHLTLAMDCQDPYEFEMHSRLNGVHNGTRKPLTILVSSRCRKCEPCRKRRQVFWQARAVTEFQSAPRTLFGTLTIHPDFDVRIDATARLELAERGVDFDRLLDSDKFRARVKYGGREVTNWLKRLREGDTRHEKPDIRYLLVAESHKGSTPQSVKTGRPHWHVLLHECDLSRPLVNPDEWSGKHDRYGNITVSDESFLKAQWRIGFSNFSHCRTPQAAGYLCKYLTKDDASVRIRASFKYGHETNVEEKRVIRSGAPKNGRNDPRQPLDEGGKECPA